MIFIKEFDTNLITMYTSEAEAFGVYGKLIKLKKNRVTMFRGTKIADNNNALKKL